MSTSLDWKTLQRDTFSSVSSVFSCYKTGEAPPASMFHTAMAGVPLTSSRDCGWIPSHPLLHSSISHASSGHSGFVARQHSLSVGFKAVRPVVMVGKDGATLKFATFSTSFAEHWNSKLTLEKFFIFEKYNFLTIGKPCRVISFGFSASCQRLLFQFIPNIYILNYSSYIYTNIQNK